MATTCIRHERFEPYDSPPRPRSLARAAPTGELRICTAKDAARLVRGVRQHGEKPGGYFFDPAVASGCLLEWTRRAPPLASVTTPTVAVDTWSRVYLSAPNPYEPDHHGARLAAHEALAALYAHLRRFVQSTYPLQTAGAHPIYIGPDLVRALHARRARLVMRGKRVALVANPRLRRRT